MVTTTTVPHGAAGAKNNLLPHPTLVGGVLCFPHDTSSSRYFLSVGSIGSHVGHASLNHGRVRILSVNSLLHLI